MNVPDVNKIINKETEILLLINFVKNDVCDLPICVQDILNGKYENVINNFTFKSNSRMQQLFRDNT